MINFTGFKRYGADPDDDALVTTVSITDRGLILLPAKFFSRLFPKKKTLFGSLLFRRQEGTLAIRFHTKKVPGAFSLTRTKWNARLAAKSALDFFQIEHKRTRTYLARVVSEENESAVFLDIRSFLRER